MKALLTSNKGGATPIDNSGLSSNVYTISIS